ncbi:DUF3888 domain-containing protein [Bacillus haynesii]|uniref:DUF3888 domain-containing protein n=1 Tax=Bacillus haynesii TaxID=1925021 RepID=UPI002DDD4473|nr:DUF3888 domain-containing protein [Bacillus haynesii]
MCHENGRHGVNYLYIIKRRKEASSLKKLLITICFCSAFLWINSEKTTAYTTNEREVNDLILTLLDPYAQKVIKKDYGLYDAKIVSVERVNHGRTPAEKQFNDGSFEFIAKVQYRTYAGPHNPPETAEEVTFCIAPSGVQTAGHTVKKQK